MKRTTAVASALFVALFAASCGSDSTEGTSNNSPDANNTNNSNNVNNSNNLNNAGDGGMNNTDAGVDMVDMENPPERAATGLDDRPANSTCSAVERPPTGADIELERAFSNLSFSSPVWLQQAPSDSDRWFVIEQNGVIKVFANDDGIAESDDFIDIRSRVTSGGERGLLGMAFSPDWPTNRTVYLSYTGNDNGLKSFISAFTASEDLSELDPDSEVRLLSVDQPFGNHNGGQIAFGPDGYLYISMGDGGSGNDPQGNGQNINTLLGAMLRIDVSDNDYSIPADNPFVNGPGEPEIYAWGLRNAWRFSFDRATGKLWAGDVGQNRIEEVSIIELGGNYGWNSKEGTRCSAVNPCDQGPWIDPIWEYQQANNNRSITGGYVYNGTQIPSLQGIYIFGDFVSGRIWGLFYDDEGEPDGRLLLETGRNISSFAEGLDGELLVIDYAGSLHRIVAPDDQASNFPPTLSATGCADPEDVTEPASGLIPYAPNAPFWSDGADKLRWVALPDGETVEVDEDGDFNFPIGTVIVKSFELDGRLIETRLLMRHEDGGWAGYTYEWREDQSDADLLPAGKEVTVAGQTWIYPSRAECMTCHTEAAGRTLGLETTQLNGDLIYESTNRISNQLATWQHLGLFTEPIEDPESLDALVDPFGTANLEERAESYMHTNCANCHRPDHPLRVDFDLRYGVDFADRGICDEEPVGDDLGIDDAVLLAGGDADRSLIYQRSTRRDSAGMPPLGSALVDSDGTTLLRNYIDSVNCP